MNEFTHEELQQVIRKYDSEYKRIKKQVNGR
jgi:translation initiation factor 2 beta subunit (eIF-2beta)/eIF-5